MDRTWDLTGNFSGRSPASPREMVAAREEAHDETIRGDWREAFDDPNELLPPGATIASILLGVYRIELEAVAAEIENLPGTVLNLLDRPTRPRA